MPSFHLGLALGFTDPHLLGRGVWSSQGRDGGGGGGTGIRSSFLGLIVVLLAEGLVVHSSGDAAPLLAIGSLATKFIRDHFFLGGLLDPVHEGQSVCFCPSAALSLFICWISGRDTGHVLCERTVFPLFFFEREEQRGTGEEQSL